jgi:hypothetical protein
MGTGLIRTAALALLVLLPIPAHAECAWVLWHEHTGVTGGFTNWTIESVWNERAQCELRARASVSREVETWSGVPGTKVRTDNDGTLVSVVMPQGAWIKHFRCLPDTIDPRWAKSK